jgi:hypothetical protein
MAKLRALLLLGTCASAASPLGAQEPAVPAAAPILRAAPLVGELRLDGRLDEAAWERAEPATAFTQSYPEPGAAPSQRTEARVLFDAANLYVGVRMHDTRADSIAAPLARRDATGLYSDWVHVMVDSRHDRRTAFRFSTNPRGVLRDVYTYDDGAEDGSWDAVWEVATSIDPEGWTAEYRIPLSQLRFGGGAEDVRSWGFQVMRDVARRGERASWAPWTRDDAGFVSRFGTLTGLEGIRAPRALELVPYASARLARVPGDEADPFHHASEPGIDVGTDLRLGLPAGLTVSATINPDFGQVEADPAEVNLSAFESFFGERRPFFTEGADIFRFGDTRAFNRYGFQEYFYSRRVGREPQRRLAGPAYPYVDAPRQTRILGAAKVSGKTPGGWSVGVMDALTGRERARFVGPDGTAGTARVEPLSNYFVGRLRRDLRGGASVVGGLLTATHREGGDPALASLLHRDAYLGGADFLHTWGGRTWSVSGYLAASRVRGSRDVLRATQRSPARYYQRPDADYLELDPERTSLAGHMAELSVARSGAWSASLQLKEQSPGFEINDLGFQGRVDARSVATFLGRQVNRPWGPFRSHGYQTWSFAAWNFGGDRILLGHSLGASAQLRNFWYVGGNASIRPWNANDRLTRGGPLSATPAQWQALGYVETDGRKPVVLGADAFHRRDVSGLRESTFGVSASARPSTAVRLSVAPLLVRNRYTAQYVRAAPDAAARATFGTRYVFAGLEQTTAALTTRLDWTFTPRLSLQLYAQPFVSAGHYSGFRELTTPGEFDFAEYGRDRGSLCAYGGVYVVAPVAERPCPAQRPAADDPDFTLAFGNPDFNVRSLRGNAVVRWEYRPGSTLFFVWQQERSGFEPLGDFDLGRDARAVFAGAAHNVFLVKASYWIGR